MNRIRRALLPIIVFAKIDIRRLFRDKVGIFFVFVFPLIFLLIFGSIFNGGSDVSFRIALVNQSQTEFAKDFDKQIRDTDVFDVNQSATTLQAAREKMDRGELDATVVLPENFGEVGDQGYPTGQAEVLYNQNNETAATSLASVMDGIFTEINNELVPYEAPFTATAESTAQEGQSRFDYTFSGLMGFTLLSLGIFGPISVFPRMKQRGVLRRYHTTTLKVWQYFVANVVSNAFVGLLSAGVMFVTALLVFDLNMRGNYLSLAFVVILGTVMLFGIGLAVGGWAKNENQAAPLGQVVSLPMMFLSGVFFPVFLMPDLLQRITQFIPLTPVVDSIRMIVTENASLFDVAPQIGIMAAWTVVIYIVAFKVFRWE